MQKMIYPSDSYVAREYTPEERAADNAETLAAIPDLMYIPEFLTVEEEQMVWDRLSKHVTERSDSLANERKAVRGAGQFSEGIRRKVYERLGWYPERCYANFYEPGNAAMSHIDNSQISENEQMVISVKCGGIVLWNSLANPTKVYRLHADPRGAFVYKNEARYVWLHGLPALPAQRISLVLNYGGAAHCRHILDSENTHDLGALLAQCEPVLGLPFPVIHQITDLPTINHIQFHPELVELRRAKVTTAEQVRATYAILKPIVDLFNEHGGSQNTPREKFLALWETIVNNPIAFHSGPLRGYPNPVPPPLQ